MKDAILTLVVTVFLVVIFSTMGAPEATTPPAFNGGWAVRAGDSGVVVAGSGTTPAEVQQPETTEGTTPAESVKTEATHEAPAEQVAGPEASGVRLSDGQRTTCNLVAVFLAGAASVIFLEIIVQAKKEEQHEPKV